jgi:flagellar capping protein FliD
MNGAVTAWQLWAAVAMPTLVALLGILLNRREVDRIDRGMESLESRLGNRIDGVESRIGNRIDGVEARLDSLDTRLNQQTQIFHQDVISLLKMHQEHDIRLTRLEQRS